LGLVTQFNPIATAPGALIQAENCVIRRENVLENRRGYATYGTLAATPSQLLTYNNTVISHHGTTLSYDNGSGTFADYSGSYTAPTGYKMRSVEATGNLYITTSAGVKVLTDVVGTAARSAGAPRALDPSYTLTGVAGFLANTSQCAYRVVVKRTDANSNVLIGYPSQRLWITNAAGGARNVILTIYIPSEAIAGDVIQVYRTDAYTAAATPDASGDEMKLAYQQTLTSSDISTGNIVVTDSIIDSLLGATLYTSPSQEGISQGNDTPPLCKDVTLYKSQFMFYANTETRHRMFLTLVGVSSLSAKTITLAGTTYNFGATEIVSGGGSPQAKAFSTGVIASDIDETARSLVRVINRYASNTSIYAYYISNAEDTPGKILLESRTLGSSAFTLNASDSAIAAMFDELLPVNPSTSIRFTSSNDVKANYLFHSKAQQSEHVPALNYIPVGPSNRAILRIVALRDSLIIIKEEGVYRLTGDNPQSFSIIPLDLTVFCKSKNSVAVLANQVFMLSNQGVVSISDTGVQVMSREIEPNITPLLTFSSLDTYTYGCAYESERSYLLSTMSTSSDTAPVQIYVFNIFTRSWTKWTYAFTTAVVNPSVDKLFLSKSSDVKVYRERKDFASTDHADPDYPITIVSVSGTTVVFSISGATPEVGWVISQAATPIPITDVATSGANYSVTLPYAAPSSWAAGAAIILPGIKLEVELAAWHGGAPGLLKQISIFKVLGDPISENNDASEVVSTFKTNLDANEEEQPINTGSQGWGDPWGVFGWGGMPD